MMPLPVEMTRFRHRWMRRAPTITDCDLSFDHPLWPQVRVHRKMLDVSYEGLSFTTELGDDLLYPGMRVPVLEVEMPGRAPVKLFGEVRNISSTSRGHRCGMWLSPLNAEEALAWRALVEDQMHPRTRVAGDWNAGVWDLFEKSGYFRLSGKDPTKFEAFKREFHETQNKLQGQHRLGLRVVRPMEGGVEATLSVVKPYAGSWLAHQLARQQPPGMNNKRASAREALRDIYLRAYEPTQLDPEVKWFFSYAEAHVRWTRFTKFDFAQWYEHTGQSALIPFQLMEGETDREWAPIPEGIELAAPTAEELNVLFQRLEATKPVAYREALDLVPERFDLTSHQGAVEPGAADAASARPSSRATTASAVAIGIVEAANPGLNLFHVLDGVRIVPLVEDDSLPEVQDGMLGLLTRASDWFRERNRRVFVHYVETKSVMYAERAVLADLGEGLIWIISSTLLPEFLEHLCESTTPRSEG